MARTKATASRHPTYTGNTALKAVSAKRRKPAQPMRKHRFRPGTVALREIRRYQKTTELLIPQLPFSRLVREQTQVMFSGTAKEFKFQASALMAIQQAAEDYLTYLFTDCKLLANHAKRKTIMAKDIQLARRIRGDVDRCNMWGLGR